MRPKYFKPVASLNLENWKKGNEGSLVQTVVT